MPTLQQEFQWKGRECAYTKVFENQIEAKTTSNIGGSGANSEFEENVYEKQVEITNGI